MTNKWKKGFATLFALMLFTVPALTSCKDKETSDSSSGGDISTAITIQLDKTT